MSSPWGEETGEGGQQTNQNIPKELKRRRRGIVVEHEFTKRKPRQGRQIGKMSLLTELEILGDGFLQRWRAYGAADAMDERDGHDY